MTIWTALLRSTLSSFVLSAVLALLGTGQAQAAAIPPSAQDAYDIA